MRKGPLTNKEKAYLRKYKNMSIKHLAGKIGATEKTVKKYIDTLKLEEETLKKQEETKQRENRLNPLDAMGVNSKYNAVVMTETASMQSDESRRVRSERGYNSKMQRFITKIKKDE